MRLGVSTYAFPRAISADRMDVDGLLDWARANGAAAVQFCENLPWPPDRPLPEGIVIETGCRGIGDHLFDHLRLAERSGSGFVRLVIDDGDDRPDLIEAARRLRPYADAYRAAGVVLAVENHGRHLAFELRALVEELGLGVVLDTANSLGRLEGLQTVVEELGPYVVNLHAKDVRAVRKPDMLGFDVEGTIFGKGDAHLDLILDRLPRLASATLEQWVPAAPYAVGREFDWARTGLRNLRRALVREEDE